MAGEAVLSLASLNEKAAGLRLEGASANLPRLFLMNQNMRRFWSAMHRRPSPKRKLRNTGAPVILALMPATTTTKAVLVSDDGDILYTHYSTNKGRPLAIMREMDSGYLQQAAKALTSRTQHPPATAKILPKRRFRSIQARWRPSRTTPPENLSAPTRISYSTSAGRT